MGSFYLSGSTSDYLSRSAHEIHVVCNWADSQPVNQAATAQDHCRPAVTPPPSYWGRGGLLAVKGSRNNYTTVAIIRNTRNSPSRQIYP